MEKKTVRRGLDRVASHARLIAQGDAVDSRFFKRHFFTTAFIVLSCIALIAGRFEHATAEATARSLQKQIDRADTYKQEQQALYMTLTRESAMIHLVDSLRLGLEISETLPQTLDYNPAPSQQ